MRRLSCRAVSVVATGSWSEVQRFQVPTQDMAGLAFSPDGAHIAVWDSSLHNRWGNDVPSRLDLAKGSLLGGVRATDSPLNVAPRSSFSLASHPSSRCSPSPFLARRAAVFTLDGTQVASVDGQDHGLGVRTAAWSPGGDFFAIAMHSGVLKLLESATWTVVAELDHPDTVEAPATCVVYNEEPAQDGRSRFAVASVPVALGPGQQAQGRGRKGAQEAGAEGTGVGRVVFSPCGTYVATVDDGNAGCVWVWALA